MSNNKPTVASLGSHSALEISRGAHQQGLPTLVVTQTGRHRTYTEHFKTRDGFGCVDETLQLTKFRELLSAENQQQLQQKNAVFVPHRSFEVYLDNDYTAIEQDWQVPTFGNKFLLRMEERTGELTQYQVLEAAGIRVPKVFAKPEEIDRLCIIKIQEKQRSYERAFFFASSPSEFYEQYQQRIDNNTISETEEYRIEEYMLGSQVNLNFFYSPLQERLELIGTDTRRQASVNGFTQLPARYQLALPESLQPTFVEAGHIATTILESMIEQAFELGERFLQASLQMHERGVIGPFSLQSMVVPTATGKEFVVFDVSPRMPGSPGIESTPYSKYLFGESVSMGARVAMEIKQAYESQALDSITT